MHSPHRPRSLYEILKKKAEAGQKRHGVPSRDTSRDSPWQKPKSPNSEIPNWLEIHELSNTPGRIRTCNQRIRNTSNGV